MSDQGTDPAAPAESTGAEDTSQVADVPETKTDAVDGPASSGRERSESDTSTGTPDQASPSDGAATNAENRSGGTSSGSGGSTGTLGALAGLEG